MKTQEVAPLIAAYLAKRDDLLRFFTLRLRSASGAEDLVQDIYVKIAALELRQEIENPVGYLYRLGSNLMLDRLRGERRSAARDAGWRENHRAFVGAEEVADEPKPEDAIAARVKLQEMVVRLQDLSPQTRRIFVLHKFDGLTHAEVAQIVGISRSAVEKHVSAALKHLAGCRL